MESHEFNFIVVGGIRVYNAKLEYDKNNEYNYHIRDIDYPVQDIDYPVDCWYSQETVVEFVNKDLWRIIK